MGIFGRIAGWLSPAPGSPSTAPGLASPWSSGSLTPVPAQVLADIYGAQAALPVGRTEAMSVPAIARARDILVSDAARAPLEALDAAGQLVATPWLQGSASGVSPQHRIVWTVDDLIFHGWSLWAVQRDENDAIADAVRVPVEWWKFGEGGQVLVRSGSGQIDAPADAASVVLIPGFHEGLVTRGADTVRGARTLERLWINRAANPVPATELHQLSQDPVDDAEVTKLLTGWRTALQAEGGALGFTPNSVELRTHGEASTDLLIQGRNAAAIDAARQVGVPAAMVDASNVNSTLTYETLEGRGGEYLERSLPLYLGAVEARLSLDDVTPAGTRVRANLSALTALVQPATGHPTED